VQKWEYLYLTSKNDIVIEVNGQLVAKQRGLNWAGPNFPEYLKELGLEGWEAVNFANQGGLYTYFFKRPVK
jgi:hypothetical protein